MGFYITYTIAVIAESEIPDRPCRDLIKYIKEKSCIAKYIPISRISLNINENSISVVIRGKEFNPDGVFLRSFGFFIDIEQFFRRLSTLKFMESKGIVFINTTDGLLKTRNKLETTLILRKHGIPTPHTVATEDLLYAYNIAKDFKDTVIKPIQGSRGYGAVRVTDADVAFQVMKTLISFKKPLYIQKYIEKPNRDIRIMVIDNEIFGCMYRISLTGNWRTNIAQGAKGIPCEKIDNELKELSLKIVEILGLTYAGIDIGENKNGYVVFEVNGSPDWRELSTVIGKNPAEKLVEVMIKYLKK